MTPLGRLSLKRPDSGSRVLLSLLPGYSSKCPFPSAGAQREERQFQEGGCTAWTPSEIRRLLITALSWEAGPGHRLQTEQGAGLPGSPWNVSELTGGSAAIPP